MTKVSWVRCFICIFLELCVNQIVTNSYKVINMKGKTKQGNKTPKQYQKKIVIVPLSLCLGSDASFVELGLSIL